MRTGFLYVVATPIGNLEDITLRALRILKEVNCILCEDKRVTVKLLNKYNIKSKLISFHKFNEIKTINEIIQLLKGGNDLALVSDAGTPLILDPGKELISTLTKENIKIIPIPGACSLTTALSVLPMAFNEFLFLGFLPPEKNKRHKILSSIKRRAKNIILFIAPHDLKKYLNEIFDLNPDVNVFYARELTKIYEEVWYGKIKDLKILIENKNLKGEIILGINFDNEDKNASLSTEEIIKIMKDHIEKGFSLKDASKQIGKEFNISSNKLYDLYIKNR